MAHATFKPLSGGRYSCNMCRASKRSVTMKKDRLEAHRLSHETERTALPSTLYIPLPEPKDIPTTRRILIHQVQAPILVPMNPIPALSDEYDPWAFTDSIEHILAGWSRNSPTL